MEWDLVESCFIFLPGWNTLRSKKNYVKIILTYIILGIIVFNKGLMQL